MAQQLIKGNEAVVKAALLAGCRAFYGYPITPASEIVEMAALYLPEVGGVFVQAESEVAAINMVYGGASVGVRAMTASRSTSGAAMACSSSCISCRVASTSPKAARVSVISRHSPVATMLVGWSK